MKKKTRTKQEHYIPRESYLELFTDHESEPSRKPFVWVYENPRNLVNSFEEVTPKKITPFNLCKISNFYETDKVPVNSLEGMLATIEGDYKALLDTKILKQQELTEEEKYKVAYFISTLETRTPTNRDHQHGFIDEILTLVKSNEQQFMGGEKSQLHQELEHGKSTNAFFALSVATAIQVNRWGMSDFLFLAPKYKSEGQMFVTSDFPVFEYDFVMMNSIYGMPPNSATIEVTVPLTPQLALLINNGGFSGYKEIDHNIVSEINNRTFNGARSYLLTSQELDKSFIDRITGRYRQSLLLSLMSDKLQDEDFERKKAKYGKEKTEDNLQE